MDTLCVKELLDSTTATLKSYLTRDTRLKLTILHDMYLTYAGGRLHTLFSALKAATVYLLVLASRLQESGNPTDIHMRPRDNSINMYDQKN